MSKSILIAGGAASGKSRWAVTYFAPCDYVLYLRVADELDPDTMGRIEYSNNQYGVEWDILTGVYKEPWERIGDHKFVIFDGLSSYTASVIREMCPDPDKMDNDMKKSIEKKIIADINLMRDRIEELAGSMIVITLDTGFSAIPTEREQATFREILGRVNQRIANTSHEVYFSASGIQFQIK